MRDQRGTIASADVTVRDPQNDQEVEEAARKVCFMARKPFPSPARITVEEERSRRFHEVRKLTI